MLPIIHWISFKKSDKFQSVDLFHQIRFVETVCLLYHQKDKFISVPYEPKDAEYLKMIPGSATYDEIKEYVLKKSSDFEVVD